MKKIISGLVGLWLVSFVFYIPIYLLFFNSGADAVKSLSLEEGIFLSTKVIHDSREADKERKKLIGIFTKEYEKRTGIDISKPIYKQLEKNNDVKNIVVKKDDSYRDKELSAYSIQYEYKGRKIAILFAVEEPSFINIKTARAYFTVDLGTLLSLVGPVYKISNSDLINIYNIFNRNISNN